MYADSICCDDLNAVEYQKRAFEMLGPFKLGGLHGFPFAGLTGMGAFAHHVPADGALFVFFGPHIGITKTGRVGFTLRPGQAEPSARCGAATAAVNILLRDQVVLDDVSELDYQQNTLEQILLWEKMHVVEAAEPLVEGTEIIYEATETRIRLLVERTKFPCRYVILMGGILINGDYDVGSTMITCSHSCSESMGTSFGPTYIFCSGCRCFHSRRIGSARAIFSRCPRRSMAWSCSWKLRHS